MKYIVYLTTNLINNKIYVGVHGTENPDIFDGYLGNAVMNNRPNSYNRRETPFQCAVSKYGPKNFKRKTLKIFDTEQEALDLEAEIVNEDFIKRTDTYNITLGGGIPPKNRVEVHQYNLDGEYVRTWNSIESIIKFYQISKDRIRMVIDEKRCMAASYWTEIFFEKLDIKEYRASARSYIRVFSPDGTLLYMFKSNKECYEQLGLTKNIVQNAVQRKTLSHGYFFLKDGDNINEIIKGNIEEKPIYQYDLDGKYLNKYDSLFNLKKELGFNKNEIKRAAKNISKFANFFWSYDKYDNILQECPDIFIPENKKIYQYTLQNEFVKEWDSITQCRKQYPSVMQVLLGKRTHCHKFKFTFEKIKDIVQK